MWNWSHIILCDIYMLRYFMSCVYWNALVVVCRKIHGVICKGLEFKICSGFQTNLNAYSIIVDKYFGMPHMYWSIFNFKVIKCNKRASFISSGVIGLTGIKGRWDGSFVKKCSQQAFCNHGQCFSAFCLRTSSRKLGWLLEILIAITFRRFQSKVFQQEKRERYCLS